MYLVNVVYCIGKDLCDRPIPRPQESYRVRPGAMTTLYTYSEKTEEVGLREIILEAAADE